MYFHESCLLIQILTQTTGLTFANRRLLYIHNFHVSSLQAVCVFHAHNVYLSNQKAVYLFYSHSVYSSKEKAVCLCYANNIYQTSRLSIYFLCTLCPVIKSKGFLFLLHAQRIYSSDLSNFFPFI